MLLLCISLIFLPLTTSNAETLYQQNFEANDSDVFVIAATNATCATDSGWASSGTYSLKFNITTEGGTATAVRDWGNSGFSTMYMRFDIYVTSGLTATMADTDYFWLVGADDEDFASTFYMKIQDDSGTDQLFIQWGGGQDSTVITLFSTDTKHTVELYHETDASAGIVQIWVDGVLEINRSSLNTGAKAPQYFYWGVNASSSVTGAYYIDDIVMDSSNYIGTGWRIQEGVAIGSLPYF